MKLLILPILILISLPLTAQNTRQDFDIQQYIEKIFAFQDSDLSYDELYESLLLYYSNPININKATKEDLRALYILNDQQIDAIIEHIKKYGNLLSVYELQTIPALSLDDIRSLLPFIRVDEHLNKDNTPLWQRITTEPNNYLLLRVERTLETKKGFTEPNESSISRYAGSPYKLYSRFRVSHTNDFSLGFTAEKDAGETFSFNHKNHGFDFYSLHFQIQNEGRLKNLILGDYQMQFGQGLLLSAGFNVGKGSETINTVRRSNIGARPYTSVLETGFFRGATATYQINKHMETTVFYSRLQQDAVLRSDSARNAYEFISSVQNSGFHRTDSEINAKNQITEQTYGSQLLFKDAADNLQVGFTVIGNHYSTPLIKSDQLYNRYAFSGNDNYNIGISGQYNWNNLALFTEAAKSKSGGIGAVGGFIINLSKSLQSSIVLRHYEKDFHSFYGSAFSEAAGSNSNESGWYWGLKYSPNRKYQVTAYFDQFSFPWLKFGVSRPSDGYEYLVRFNYQPSRKALLYAQFRQESKATDITMLERPMVLTANGIKNNWIISADLDATDNITLKTRIQFSNYNLNNRYSEGLALIQDLNVKLNKFRISTRFALFDTDDYENRQYAYERDVLYSFAIPAYHGRGTRTYILLQYKINQHFDIWLKYAQTQYRHQDSISSGLEEIEGSTKTDIKCQLRVRF